MLAATPPAEMLIKTPSQLVAQGYCDPVRLFVKQEPHNAKKLAEGRYRLISSVSLVDQLIERLLFGPQNELEIASWRSIPSKPGMGLSLYEQAQSIWQDLLYKSRVCPAAEADISGFDWSVQEWELWADVSMRIRLCEDMHPKLACLFINRFRCFSFSVFQLSNGELYEQCTPGLMKSGSYCTSSTNSRIRCLMGFLIGSPWIIAMGDDSVEGWVEGAQEKYEKLGHVCKEYTPCEVDREGDLRRVNFCSHELSYKKFWLTTWPRTLFRFLDRPGESFDELRSELESGPAWPRILAYLSQVGKIPDKTVEAKQAPQDEEETDKSAGQANDCQHCPSGGLGGTLSPEETPEAQEERPRRSYEPNGHFDHSARSWWNNLSATEDVLQWLGGSDISPLRGGTDCQFWDGIFCLPSCDVSS